MSHCGTFERALRQVAAAPSPRNTWTGARYARPAKVTATPTRWRPIARAIGAKVSCSRANGAQATEVDCVGVHAVAAENVWTRDPDVDPTMRFLSRKLRPFGCRPAAVGRDASWTAIAVRFVHSPVYDRTKKNGFRCGCSGHADVAPRVSREVLVSPAPSGTRREVPYR